MPRSDLDFLLSLKRPSSLQSIEELEDAAVLMRQALQHPPSSRVPVIMEAEHSIENLLKPKKEKKSKRSKLGSKSLCTVCHELPRPYLTCLSCLQNDMLPVRA